MADSKTEIINPQLSKFCNDNLRTLADKLAFIDSVLPAVMAEYNAKNLGTIINDSGASNTIVDGSETDGRTRKVGGDVYNLVTALQELQNYFDTPGRRDVILGWQVNGVKVNI